MQSPSRKGRRSLALHIRVKELRLGSARALRKAATVFRARLSERAKLLASSGLTMREAAQRYFAISNPELYELMTQQLGWSVTHHQRWLADTAAGDLLGHT